MTRIFTHPDGSLNPYPFTRSEARRLRKPRYDDHTPCEICRDVHQTRTSIKYTRTDRCIHCAFIEAGNFYNLVTDAPTGCAHVTDAMVEALSLCDGDNRAVMHPCTAAGHLGVRMPDGGCWFCDQSKVDSRLRAAARREKEAQYLPANPCTECKKTAPRITHTNQCTGCMVVKTSPRQAAQRAGEAWYTPDKACKRCDKKALKRVNNGECQGCRT